MKIRLWSDKTKGECSQTDLVEGMEVWKSNRLGCWECLQASQGYEHNAEPAALAH